VLVVLPDPVTPFAGSTFEQAQSFSLAEDAGLLVLDWFTAGRRASGERWAFDRYRSRLEIARAGQRVFLDHLWLSGDDGPVVERMRQFNVYALAVRVRPRSDQGQTGVRPGSDHGNARFPRPVDLVWSVAPLSTVGEVIRVAGTSTEQVAAVVRIFCAPISSLIGADPWTRRW
jgi:urease accessory protein